MGEREECERGGVGRFDRDIQCTLRSVITGHQTSLDSESRLSRIKAKSQWGGTLLAARVWRERRETRGEATGNRTRNCPLGKRDGETEGGGKSPCLGDPVQGGWSYGACGLISLFWSLDKGWMILASRNPPILAPASLPHFLLPEVQLASPLAFALVVQSWPRTLATGNGIGVNAPGNVWAGILSVRLTSVSPARVADVLTVVCPP